MNNAAQKRSLLRRELQVVLLLTDPWGCHSGYDELLYPFGGGVCQGLHEESFYYRNCGQEIA